MVEEAQELVDLVPLAGGGLGLEFARDGGDGLWLDRLLTPLSAHGKIYIYIYLILARRRKTRARAEDFFFFSFFFRTARERETSDFGLR